MGKPKSQRKLSDDSALAEVGMLRTSPQKLGLLANMISGSPVDKALVSLEFSPKRISGAVKKCLESAIANAENNHGLEIDRLVVAEASVGKHVVMRRFRPRARGRASRIAKHFSRLRIVVREAQEEVA